MNLTIQSRNTHEIQRVTIWYRWHPFYGETVPLVRGRAGSHCLRCEFPDGTTATIPVWMTDADLCAQMSVGEPTISLPALAELRAFLDSWFRDQGHTAEHADAEKGNSLSFLIGAPMQAGPDSGSPCPNSRSETESRWEVPE